MRGREGFSILEAVIGLVGMAVAIYAAGKIVNYFMDKSKQTRLRVEVLELANQNLTTLSEPSVMLSLMRDKKFKMKIPCFNFSGFEKCRKGTTSEFELKRFSYPKREHKFKYYVKYIGLQLYEMGVKIDSEDIYLKGKTFSIFFNAHDLLWLKQTDDLYSCGKEQHIAGIRIQDRRPICRDPTSKSEEKADILEDPIGREWN